MLELEPITPSLPACLHPGVTERPPHNSDASIEWQAKHLHGSQTWGPRETPAPRREPLGVGLTPPPARGFSLTSTPRLTLSPLMAELGAVIFTSTSMGCDRGHRVGAASSPLPAWTVLGTSTKTPGEPLTVNDLHFSGAHLVGPARRQISGHRSLHP